MAVSYPIADEALVKRLNLRLEEFRTFRINYVKPSEDNKQEEVQEIEQIIREKKKRKRSVIEKFFFSDYD